VSEFDKTSPTTKKRGELPGLETLGVVQPWIEGRPLARLSGIDQKRINSITRKVGVFASGKLEKGGSDSNTETFYRDPAG